MSALHPRQIVSNVPGWGDADGASRRRNQIIKGAEADDVRSAERRGACRFQTLPGEAAVKDVDQILPQRRVVTGGESFTIVEIGEARRLTRKLLSRVVVVILQIAAPEEIVLAAFRQVVIETRDVCVPTQVNRRVEAEAECVEVVADRVVVRQRILFEDRQHRGIRTKLLRIKGRHTGGVKLSNLGCGFARISVLQEGESAVAKVAARYDSHDRLLARVAAAFVI